MLPRVINSPTKTIKIKSPKSDIKLHKTNFCETKTSPELILRSSTSQSQYDEITQAWNRLEISAFSKAIAMSSDIGPCTLGPNAASSVGKPPGESSDEENSSLGKATTSTPVKQKKSSKKKNTVESSAYNTKNHSLEAPDVQSDKTNESSFLDNFLDNLEQIRLKYLKEVELQIKTSADRVRKERQLKWLEHDAKVKEALAATKEEIEKEQLLRAQEHYIQEQKVISETKASEQLKAQQLEQSKTKHEQRIVETSEKLKQIEQKRKDLEEQQKQKRQEFKRCVDSIYELQVAYRKKYNQITEMTMKCKDMRQLNGKVSGELVKLREMNNQIMRLTKKCNEGKVSTKDLKTAGLLVEEINVIAELFAKYTGEIEKAVEKAEEEKKRIELETELRIKQEEAERQQKAQEDKAMEEEKAKQEEKSKQEEKAKQEMMKNAQPATKLIRGVEDCISGECLQWHLQMSKFLEDYEKKLQPLVTNDSLKKFRFDCQKAVNVPVNAISPLDDLHLEDKRYRLSRLLQGQAVALENTMFLVTGHPLGIPFCKNLLAKKFVKQGEHAVSSKPESAFAIAAVIVALWVDFPDFGRLLLAHFHRECPYLIPAFMPQMEGESNEDYYKKLGYQYSSDGQVEPQDKFLRRMSGVMRLYSAILVTPLKRSQMLEGKLHPHNMRDAWRWFTATLNLRPRPDISPTLIFDFLEVTGRMLFSTYGHQFSKLLQFLCTDYFSLIEQVTPDGCGGPVVRLKGFLEKILKEGQVPPPTGLLPHNFW